MTIQKTIFAGLLALTPITAQAGDWTGFYGGLSLGQGNLEASGGGTDGTRNVGIFAGYNHDFGDVVVGGELEHSSVNFDGPLATFAGHTTRVKAKVGYDAGQWMPYAFLGTGQANFGTLNDSLTNYGVGVAYQMGNGMHLGAEYMKERSDGDFAGTGDRVEIETLNLRVGLKF